ncbi:MAG: hypothetical protein COU81_02680 [Candidatus Portnoybacteria bacterium CG10_big_fil_rev_8_21_14_0_10_36_7]|uniref:Type II toxin-antitoxin system antitoxin, RelB/DinJ family n=1 Tax=Candidatus Portnoybacteria bacterium CG10_big_fil_rev_8_21_14_0_10_36_7 TaxID=1974812 RepID=A0A2M8KDS2_9BACT|nr:MAG: hypothetical protein COU81_02680 [Candidatus Portnoybacteria bacterium CG10_big_fil_rev_8_21_14_0_10_36_7]
MNTAVINIKTRPEVKTQAQEVASELGISLSSLINAFLRHLVKTKQVTFSLDEQPSKYLLKVLKESKKDIKDGRVSSAFDNVDNAIKWLNNPHKKYQNER